MSTTTILLNAEERISLVTEELLQLGPYDRKGDQRPFVLGLDARALVALFDAALCGSRVYELMTISRPAELFNYLYLNFVDIHPEVLKYVQNYSGPRARFDVMPFLGGMAFPEFDRCFHWDVDGTFSFWECWLKHRDSDFWTIKLRTLLALTKKMQKRLRQVDDLLLKNEINLIDQNKHRRDFLISIDRIFVLENKVSLTTSLPEELYEAIVSLVKNGNVNSVSCPLNDYALWHFLVEEQMRRSLRSDKKPRDAFFLSGSDGGINFVPEDYGCDVHIPYEGATGADLFIKPQWHNFQAGLAGKGGSLHQASYTKAYHYMLTQEDYGELECASRTQIGEWILYENKVRIVFSNSN